MEIPTVEDSHSQPSPNSSDVGVLHNQDDLVPQLSDSNGNGESDPKLSAEEVKGVLEIIASTGKFWHEWDELKSMLLFQLKQVLSEYPEARIPDDQQNPSLGESYTQLVKSLEEALFSFLDGPPFTLQRLCEILLNAQTIYPNLSKLGLALEKLSVAPAFRVFPGDSILSIPWYHDLRQSFRASQLSLYRGKSLQHSKAVVNLLVTSTVMKSTDSYPPSVVQLEDASREQVEDAQPLPQPLREPEPESQPLREPEPEPQPLREPEPASVREPEPEPEPQPPPYPPHSISIENGGEPVTGDRDEVMSEVDAEVDDGMTIDMETFEEIISSSEANPQSNSS